MMWAEALLSVKKIRPDQSTKPDWADSAETWLEQHYLYLGVILVGAFLALMLLLVGVFTGVRAFLGVALVVLVAAILLGVFLGNDVNYRIRRTKERAEQRAARERSRS